MAPLGYDEAVRALGCALVFGIHPSLGGITELCDALGRPQDSFRSVQVTGTNGKTSTVRLTEAFLRAHGVRTGLYTSPHLERYPERIEVDGAPLTDKAFGAAVGAVLDAARTLRDGDPIGSEDGFTEFEILTAAALYAFREAGVQVAVLEVGMGGRWDATSVVAPAVSVVTGVALDHAAVLGDTLELIAAEKAAIIRSGGVAVLGPGTEATRRIFLVQAATSGVSVITVGEREPADVRFSVSGEPDSVTGHTEFSVEGLVRHEALAVAAPVYQAANAATALAAAEALVGDGIDTDVVRRALGGITFPGRFEVLREAPPLVVDGSHNPQAASVLAASILSAWPDPSCRPHVLLGVLADKDAGGIVEALADVAAGISVVGLDHRRALGVTELARRVETVTGAAPGCYPSMREAFEDLVAVSDGSPAHAAGLVVTGSLVTAGEARAAWRSRREESVRDVGAF